ncbi:hypothetical protein EDS67_09950 [candidate division KSB1 bacterium]|nr:MAG: hypothetical protein EDS67_09950 [candidate division KSB1 bacterium]MBC6948999.1 hypothetical protein [candidate division KSB1 bacterium]MCE7941822.1 hypothetical protein [Chlorobi bacterium CHB1]
MGHLAEFNRGEIFLDANILLYEFTSHPRFGSSCHELVAKTEQGAVKSFLSPFVITEIIHKLMILETCDRFNLHISAAITYLKNTPPRDQKPVTVSSGARSHLSITSSDNSHH